MSATPLILILGLMILILTAVLGLSLRQVKKIRASLEKLKRSFSELDDQARLIIKTDLELNTTQEELDKRLSGLDALQKISRLISTTLDENEIFRRLNHSVLTELGFERFLILMYDAHHELRSCLSLGYSQEDLEGLIPFLTRNEPILRLLNEHQIVSSLHFPGLDRNELQRMLRAHAFVLTPIFEQKETLGLLLAGSHSETFSVTEGDEELISILADQISQAIKNAKLFEEVYRTSQSLESKVQERTRELTATLEELKRISSAKSEFVSAVSHELRTPLTSIKGYASLLMAGKMGEIPANVHDRLDKINKHSDSLVRFINELLDISRIESGRVAMQRSPQNLAPLVEGTRDLLTPQMKEKNIHFLAELPAELPQVFIDPTQIERVFINLIGNAVKFTPENGRITVHAVTDEDSVTVGVSDTGIGMKPEEIASLFSEFYRAENVINQNVKGSGLGLVLAKKIIEAHGGRIWVTSVPGEGTTFSFTLPLKKETEKD